MTTARTTTRRTALTRSLAREVVDMSALYIEVGRRVRRYRRARHCSKADVARGVGLSRTSVANIEDGSQHTPLHQLADIALFLGADISDLVPSLRRRAPKEAGNGLAATPDSLVRKSRRRTG
jgi:transcriptional regulator with XRE-family HTH domain